MEYYDPVHQLRAMNPGTTVNEEPRAAPQAPAGMDRAKPVMDPMEAYLTSLLERPPTILQPRSRYGSVPTLNAALEQEMTDFKDGTLLSREAITLNEMGPSMLTRIGRYTIPQISAGFSQYGVVAIFVLAYNLRDPSDDTLICREIEGEEVDKAFQDLPSIRQLYGTDYTSLPSTTDEKTESQEYCFLAASLLRLFTKSEENYIRAFNHIIAGYKKFYGKDMITSPPTPTSDALRTLKYYFSSSELYKMTLFRFLHAGGGVEKALGMKRFLYEIHLANTGMHIVSIAAKLVQVLHCTPQLLFEAIYSPEFEHQIDGLANMFQLAVKTDPDHERQMWKFGRVFDQNFMSSLQTRSCAKLTYVLAAALKKAAPNSNRDILSVAQLVEVGPEARRQGDVAATFVLRHIRAIPG